MLGRDYYRQEEWMTDDMFPGSYTIHGAHAVMLIPRLHYQPRTGRIRIAAGNVGATPGAPLGEGVAALMAKAATSSGVSSGFSTFNTHLI